MTSKTRRRRKILEFLERQRIRSQEELRRLLHGAGFATTQTTLSRDLRDLGVSKGPSGYILPGSPPPPRMGARELESAVRSHLISADRGGNLVVLRTPPGHAQAIALALDQTQLRGVLGTVAGDDTVLVVTSSSSQGAKVLELLRQLSAQD